MEKGYHDLGSNRRSVSWLPLLASVLLIVFFASCSGGGEDDEIVNTKNELLDGDYVEAAVWSGGCGLYRTEYTGDGKGRYDTLYHSGNDIDSDGFTYEIDERGTLTATRRDGEIWRGIVSDDGELVVYVADHGAMAIEVKQSSTASNSMLIGNYVEAAVWGGSGIYGIAYDGLGTGDYETMYSSDGNSKTNRFSFLINDNGTLEAEEDPGDRYNGIIDASSNPVVYIGDGGEMEIGVKRSTNASNALLMGEYIEAAAWIGGSGLYLVEYDGNGNGHYQTLYHSDGRSSMGAFTYHISPDGTLTASEPGRTLWHGVVSHDGELVVYVHDLPSIEIGVRKHNRVPPDPTPSSVTYCNDRITIDGSSADWEESGSVLQDPAGDGGFYDGLDVLKLFVINDDDNACLRLDRFGTRTLSGEYFNFWIYFNATESGGPSFAIEAFHESADRVYARLWDTTAADGYHEYEKIMEGIPSHTTTTSMEFSWPLDHLSTNVSYELEFMTHHTIDGDWVGPGDRENSSVIFSFEN